MNVRLTAEVSLHCDWLGMDGSYCDADQSFKVHGDKWRRNAEVTRLDAKGWALRLGKWFCPAHAELMKVNGFPISNESSYSFDDIFSAMFGNTSMPDRAYAFIFSFDKEKETAPALPCEGEDK